MKCSEIMDVCRKLAPEDCACDWGQSRPSGRQKR